MADKLEEKKSDCKVIPFKTKKQKEREKIVEQICKFAKSLDW